MGRRPAGITMQCEHDKNHDYLSFAALRHLTGILDQSLQTVGIRDASTREQICGSFIFQSSYFLDNQWVKFGEKRYRVGLCFQEFTAQAFQPDKAIVTDYVKGTMLHEAAIGVAETHFTKDPVVRPFESIGEVYELPGATRDE
jgi:hypothetical protein